MLRTPEYLEVGALALDDAGSPADLDTRLTAALERVGHVTRALVWQRAYANGLSPIQMQILLHLVGRGQPERVSDLASAFDVTLATVSDALAALRRKNLVRREQGTADRRSFVFSLTGTGAALAADLEAWSSPVRSWLSTVDTGAKAGTLRTVLDLLGALHRDGIPAIARTCVTCRFFDRNAHDDALAHHCLLLDVAFGDAGLRVDCADHLPATA
jgi:DNA-binding MarR family transcriptional regulator